ncbi:MAG TPA: hypothetical protein VH601_20815 [Bryobacteraceae bacterium]
MTNERSHLALPVRPDYEEHNEQKLCISVVFTNEPATMVALKRAAELAAQLNARIRIVMPQVVPYPLPIDRPTVDPAFRARRFLNLSLGGALDIQIDVRLCRNSWDGLTQALAPQSVVVIGGSNRRFARERRLMRRLALAGYDVVFVPQN